MSDMPLWDGEDEDPRPSRVSASRRKFLEFHEDNPHVYEQLKHYAFVAYNAGRRRIGIAHLFERLRWDYTISTSGEEFKLNNNHKAHYARMLMQNVEEFDGMFELRETRS